MKARRQAKILELVKNHAIGTQEDLADWLTREGIPVTQATISRDIKELQLQKVPAGDGVYRYTFPDDQLAGTLDRRKRILAESIISADYSENLVVIRAVTGMAANVAYTVDQLNWPDVIGSVAGEDTVMVVVRPKESAPAVVERIRTLMR